MTTTRLVTAEQFAAIPAVPGAQLELVRGGIVEMPGANKIHGMIAFLLARILHEFVSARNLGVVNTDNTAYIIGRDPDTIRIPDVSFVSWERAAEEEFTETYWSLAPDLAVEIVSPTDHANELLEKTHQYFAAGTRLVWVVWPRQRSVHVYTANGHIRELHEDTELDGGDVLPGFRVRVGDLFAVPTRPGGASEQR